MAEIDAETAAAVCRSLERVLRIELRTPVECRNVADQGRRWDFEALDRQGNLIRRVSFTQTVPERMARAHAHIRDVRLSVDSALAARGVRGLQVSFHGRHLPESRAARRSLGAEVAQRVERLQRTGQPIIEDPITSVLAGRHPYSDPLAKAFADVSTHPVRDDIPARVVLSGDDRLGHRIPRLDEEVLPAIAGKAARHAKLTPELTLVVESVITEGDRLGIRQMQARLEAQHRGFKSVYLGKLRDGRFPLRRIY